MAITDNTAKWQVKKVTNFTDKEREIATQAQAEEGVDNTKVMTPLRVKQLGDKNYLKLSGGLLSGSITQIVGGGNSALRKNVDNDFLQLCGGSSQNNGSSLLLFGENYAYSSYGAGFEIRTALDDESKYSALRGKRDGTLTWNSRPILTTGSIATQAQAEDGTDNTTVMSPLRVKQFGDKTYLPLSGGTVNGNLGVAGIIHKPTNTGELTLIGGADTGSAYLQLFGKENQALASVFFLACRPDLGLYGSPNGELYWGNSEVITKATEKKFYGLTETTSSFTASYDGFLIAMDSAYGDARTISGYVNGILVANSYDHHSSKPWVMVPYKVGDIVSITAPSGTKFYKMELR